MGDGSQWVKRQSTCVGCGAPALAESSARLAGGMIAHYGCVSVFGLSGLVDDDEPARAVGTD